TDIDQDGLSDLLLSIDEFDDDDETLRRTNFMLLMSKDFTVLDRIDEDANRSIEVLNIWKD
ncbi:MAG: hypothetical protein OXC80_00860, partial [Gammaproteobacteria bacterium]|nr:hypothetical protein [Gammaproteobacteria bacterium]